MSGANRKRKRSQTESTSERRTTTKQEYEDRDNSRTIKAEFIYNAIAFAENVRKEVLKLRKQCEMKMEALAEIRKAAIEAAKQW